MKPKSKGWNSRVDQLHSENIKEQSSILNNRGETVIHDSQSAIMRHPAQDRNVLHQDDIEIGKLQSPEHRKSLLDVSQSKVVSVSQGSSKRGKTDSVKSKKEEILEEKEKPSNEGVELQDDPEENPLKDLKEKELPAVVLQARETSGRLNRGETAYKKPEEEDDEPKPSCKQKLAKVLKSSYWSLLISVLTLYTLFSDDIKEVAFTPVSNRSPSMDEQLGSRVCVPHKH